MQYTKGLGPVSYTHLILKGERRYPVALGTDPLGNIIRLDNSLNNFPERLNSAENELCLLYTSQQIFSTDLAPPEAKPPVIQPVQIIGNPRVEEMCIRDSSKIESDGGAPYIKTVYGMGYQWTGGEAK